MSIQRLGKYACLELERRYLLDEIPSGLAGQPYSWYIVDRYILNTRLRLRRMSAPGNEKVILKLGQKYRDDHQSEVETTLTNLYLNEAEFNCLANLNATEIVKKRSTYRYGGFEYGIDVFEGKLAGLILAEIECETIEELAAVRMPAFALKDVTDDLFFAGGNLASLSRAEFEMTLATRLGQ